MSRKLHLPETGQWGEAAQWQLRLTRELTPEQRQLSRAVACVAINNIDAQEMILVQSKRGWGMVAETMEADETVEQTAIRGLEEEGGFIFDPQTDRLALFALKRVVNNPAVKQKHPYPPVSYMPYFYAYSQRPKQLVKPYGEEIIGRKTPSLTKIIELTRHGILKQDEGALMETGFLFAAAQRINER